MLNTVKYLNCPCQVRLKAKVRLNGSGARRLSLQTIGACDLGHRQRKS